MTELEKYIETISRDLPETITKEQFYRIAHISKSTARWLLQSGLVPCHDSGKKTRRYTIKTEDVIEYLKLREIDPHRYDIPTGNRPGSKAHCREGYEHRELFIHMDDGQRALLRSYFEACLTDCYDLMDVTTTACMLGYSQSAIVKWCVTGRVKAFLVSGKYLIPKICLVDYLMSSDAMCIRQKSFRHEILLKEFVDNMEGNSSKYVKRMLEKMEYDVPYTSNEIMVLLGLKSKETLRRNYLNPAIEEGLVRMTLPDKPNSKNQRYVKQ